MGTECVDQRSEEYEWVERCLRGETWVFRRLVERHERMVRAVIRRLTEAEHEVEEIAQQAFVAAYENLAQYSGEAKFSTWLCQIALNKCRDHLRARRRRSEDGDASLPEIADAARGPEGLLEDKRQGAGIEAALRRLKATDRELIVFKYVLDQDYKTVGRILGCTPEAAKVRSHRAREELKKILERMGITP